MHYFANLLKIWGQISNMGGGNNFKNHRRIYIPGGGYKLIADFKDNYLHFNHVFAEY